MMQYAKSEAELKENKVEEDDEEKKIEEDVSQLSLKKNKSKTYEDLGLTSISKTEEQAPELDLNLIAVTPELFVNKIPDHMWID